MSTIREKLQSSKDGLDALLSYANATTKAADTNLGDAVKTLCDGYGQGGGDDLAAQIVQRTVASVSISDATSIGSYAFYRYSRLTSVNFPEVTTIGNTAFSSCSALTSVSFPKVTSIGDFAFAYCSALTSVSFPKVTSIGSNAFVYCRALTSVNFPEVTTIGSSAFGSCRALTSVSIPKATSIGSNAFVSCSALTSVNFPEVTRIGSSAFFGCVSLSSITIGTSNCSLSNSNAFLNTGITANTGYIMVPAAYADAYKSSANWSYFKNRIFAHAEDSGEVDL